MRHPSIHILLFLMIAPCIAAAAGSEAVPGRSAAPIIESIRINGPKRSRITTIIRIIDIEPGDTWYEGLEKDVRDELLDQGIYRQETLTVETFEGETGKILHIHVEDRWTLLPIPIVMASDGSWTAGLFLAEGNLFGRGILASAGFLYGSEMTYLGLFSKFDRHTGAFGYREKERKDLTVSGGDSEVLRAYDATSVEVRIAPGLDFGNWAFNWDLSYLGAFVDPGSEAAGVPGPEGGHHFITGPELVFDDTTHVSVFTEGLRVTLDAEYITPRYGSVTGEITTGHLANKVFLSSVFGFGWGERPDVAVYELGGGPTGSRTLPKGIAATSYVHGTARASAVVVPMGSLKLTGYGFYEVGTYRDLRNDEVLYHGPGAGVSLYLDKVAIPAMDFVFAWNVPMAAYYLSFSIGVSF